MHTIIKLIFFQCQSLGLQVDDTLNKIPSYVYYKDLKSDIAYLVNDQREILCTILKDKDAYESKNNQDRRIVNKKNGFNIIWEQDGSCCSIHNENSKTGNRSFFFHKPVWRNWAILLVSVFFIGVLIGYFIKGIDKQESTIIINAAEIDSLKIKNQKLHLMIDSLQDAITNLEKTFAPYRGELKKDSLRSEAVRMKKELQSMSCNSNTVNRVRNWWQSLDLQEKDIVKEKYDFESALRIYSQFFNARNRHDIKILWKNEDVFSPSQRRIMRDFMHSKDLDDIYKERSMSFHMLEKYYIDKKRTSSSFK